MATFDILLPPPILYHSQKHHLETLRESLVACIEQKTEVAWETYLQTIRTIGHSQLDIYVGVISAVGVAATIRAVLQQQHLLDIGSFEQWLVANNGYREIVLEDESRWTLRLGNMAERFVHIHPSRHAPHTQRIDAYTLQTAVAVVAYGQLLGVGINLTILNKVRKDFLGLSPIGQLSKGRGIDKWIEIFAKEFSISR